MVNHIYPPELQLNKANTSDTEAPFSDLHKSISNGFVSSKIYDKRDDFDFDIVNFPFLDGDVPRSTSYGAEHSLLACKSAIVVQVKRQGGTILHQAHTPVTRIPLAGAIS